MTSEGKVHYYEFSRATRNVYLFAMESQGEVIGVLSVDTTADSRWLPFVVKELKLIAELGAIAISVAHLGKGVGQGAADGG
jgi:transcriptional regulator with GAF, ATPase, and Fis domain